MGYQALLFCPDEKTARTVTQVLSELEFNVEACIEPFAAVKKLMGQHFDAVVVDCDNEQNATLLFKSARNSTSNQTSLAVAVVEGQAGVAKAFRIGANLVLTKPINIEQAKGTLRVARGLLRKSEPTKTATTTAVPAAPTSPAPVKPIAPPKTDVPRTIVESRPAPPAPVSPPRPPVAPAAKPVTPQAWPAPVASSNTVEPDDDLLEIGGDDSGVTPAVALESPAPSKLVTPVAPTGQLHVSPAATQVQAPVVAKPTVGSGAASAPAPARETRESAVVEETPKRAAEDLFEKPTESAQPASAGVVGSAPSFTFGGSDATDESSGGSKKIFLGVVAVAIVAVGLYFGWTHFHGSPQTGTAQPAATAASVPTPSLAKPSTALPKPTATSAPPAAVVPTEVSPAPKKQQQSEPDATVEEENSTSVAKPSASAPITKTPASENPEPTTLFVKGGKAPIAATKAVADAPAPSVIGMATPGAATPPPPLVTGAGNSMRPVLQTLNVSQGVSQGLLYKKVAPSYPSNALRMKIEGTVELLATISKTGDITNIKVVSGDSQLTRAATDAVKQWKYKPYLLNGEPVEITTQVTVRFKLPH